MPEAMARASGPCQQLLVLTGARNTTVTVGQGGGDSTRRPVLVRTHWAGWVYRGTQLSQRLSTSPMLQVGDRDKAVFATGAVAVHAARHRIALHTLYTRLFGTGRRGRYTYGTGGAPRARRGGMMGGGGHANLSSAERAGCIGAVQCRCRRGAAAGGSHSSRESLFPAPPTLGDGGWGGECTRVPRGKAAVGEKGIRRTRLCTCRCRHHPWWRAGTSPGRRAR